MKSMRTLWTPLGTFFRSVEASSSLEGYCDRSTGMRIFSAFASTSPTSTPPSWVKRIQSPCLLISQQGVVLVGLKPGTATKHRGASGS